ncbi:16S rRNA (cytosine(1402)-N(4))-methyltransferase RsmH [Ruminococcus sp. Marseille-P6503]|uniref:16S rRNA (cytosine(1402)-N(4))-methyltransferase RsmH n=1 Tax=Ruminococcus sp. Marseille-P6503 TaxID=2364796 RepID=UPI000F51DA13|nr:16S rRNA (cytosine(1402)-N(4))-methyltransferase RsmH [Ruminococcus sp. Marseille-P6503]
MEFKHISVLLDECLDGLAIKPDGVYVDGTAGGAGHSREIAKRLDPSKGRLIALDRDPEAVKTASERLEGLPAQVVLANYSEMDRVLDELGADGADGILLDLGVSSYQLDNAERGFSYHGDAPLDMRMSGEGISAKDIVNGFSAEELGRIIFEYGEEKYARSIASNIVKARGRAPIETTGQLAEIIKSSVPQRVRRDKNPCKKTFQAIRIAVNDELGHLDKALDTAFDCLKHGGRMAVITFHSLEDRLVKQRFASFARGCICPPEFPVCVCGRTPRGKLVNKRPIEPGEEELAANRRSRSAKLRIIEKI